MNPAQAQQQTTVSQHQIQYNPTMTDFAARLAIQSAVHFVEKSIEAPAERVKMLTVVEGELKRQGRLPAQVGFDGLTRCIRRVWQKEGASGFLRGLGTDVLLSIPGAVVDQLAVHAVFRALSHVIPEQTAESMSTAHVVFTSLAATASAVALATPFNALRKCVLTNYMGDLVAAVPSANGQPKVREVSDEEEAYLYSSPIETIRTIHRKHGWTAFYRGAALDPLIAILYRSTYFATVLALNGPTLESYPFLIDRGLFMLTDTLVHPLEVISRRLQMTASAEASDEASVPGSPKKYIGVVDCARTIVEEEGVTALYAGLRCRLLVTLVGAGLRVLLSSMVSGRNVDMRSD